MRTHTDYPEATMYWYTHTQIYTRAHRLSKSEYMYVYIHMQIQTRTNRLSENEYICLYTCINIHTRVRIHIQIFTHRNYLKAKCYCTELAVSDHMLCMCVLVCVCVMCVLCVRVLCACVVCVQCMRACVWMGGGHYTRKHTKICS